MKGPWAFCTIIRSSNLLILVVMMLSMSTVITGLLCCLKTFNISLLVPMTIKQSPSLAKFPEQMQKKKRDVNNTIYPDRKQTVTLSQPCFPPFDAATNCNQQQISDTATASAKLVLRAQNLCLKIIRHSVHCCLS